MNRRISKFFIALLIVLCASTAQAQVAPLPFLKPQWFNNSGQPCSGCLINTYVAGTTTPQGTFSDALGSFPNANPVVLDATGRAFVFLSANSYKFTMTTASGIVLWTVDNITASNLSLLASNNTWTGTNTFQAQTTFNGPVRFNVGFTSFGPNTLGGGGSMSGTFSGSPIFSGTPNFSNGFLATTGSFSGQITSTVTTGTPPFLIASTTQVANLNASQLEGFTWEIPSTIGITTPNTGKFTTLNATTSLTVNGSTAQTGVQGTDVKLLSVGTVAGGAGKTFCTDANSGATTTGCFSAGITQIEAMLVTTGICTASAGETKCTSGPYTWPLAFADASYALVCTYLNPTGTGTNPGAYGPYYTSKTATQFSIVLQGGSASAAGNVTTAEISCIGVHP